MVSNSERQTTGTAFRLVNGILRNTPYFREFVDKGHVDVQALAIKFDDRQNEIQALASEATTIVGRGVDDAQISEGYAMRDSSMYDASASSQGDRWNAQSLLDSVVSKKGHFYHNLFSLAKTGNDPTIFFSHIEYKDLDEATRRNPAHMSKAWLKSRSAQMPPLEFQMMHLNRWVDAAQNLFKKEDLLNCYRPDIVAPIDKEKREALEKEFDTTFEFGVGIDRKQPGIATGENSCVTAVAQFYDNALHRQRYIILNQWVFPYEDAEMIKDCLRWVRTNHIYSPHVIFEVYQSGDLHQWAFHQEGYQSELFHASTKYQNIIFNGLYNVIKDHDLLIPAGLPLHAKLSYKEIHPALKVRFIKELLDFEYDAGEGGYFVANEQKGLTKPRIVYGHPKGTDMETGDKYMDDTVYSGAWALFSMRKEKTAEAALDEEAQYYDGSMEAAIQTQLDKIVEAQSKDGRFDPHVGEV